MINALWSEVFRILVRYGMHLLFLMAYSVTPVIAEIPGASEFSKTDFTRSAVDLSEITSGGPPKDGIPAIDEPVFVDIAKAGVWLDADEPVIVVHQGVAAKAYPLQILIWHEIVNDMIATVPITVTFCPLCNSSIVFERRVKDLVLDFGTTGRLRKSDLVMYDRQTESWWQQLTGKGIIGAFTGEKLKQIPAQIVSFAQFRQNYPHGQVLSRDTGYVRAYGNNPYRGYDSVTDQPFLFFDPVDSRLPPMERVLNISVGERHKIYPFSPVAALGVVNDQFAGVPLVVLSRESGTHSALDKAVIAQSKKIPSLVAYQSRLNGQTLTFQRMDNGVIKDTQTGSAWNIFGYATAGPLKGEQLSPVTSAIHFAFAWLAFHPDSEIFTH